LALQCLDEVLPSAGDAVRMVPTGTSQAAAASAYDRLKDLSEDERRPPVRLEPGEQVIDEHVAAAVRDGVFDTALQPGQEPAATGASS
jgi:hypothetical protein